jgi:hypothetical protein
MMSSKRTITMGTELRLEALFMFLLGPPFESIRQMRMLLWSRVPQFDRSRSRASHCALSRAAPILAKLCSTHITHQFICRRRSQNCVRAVRLFQSVI